MHQVELRHWWFRGRRRLLTGLLGKVGQARNESLRILDYGCGTAGNTTSYASYGTVIGIEPDAFAVRVAHARGGAFYCRAGGLQLPFRASTFDVVMASDVLEHIEDDFAAVAEVARVLRPGGSAIVSVPAHQWLFSYHDRALHHFRRYSKTGLRNLFTSGGLRVRQISYWNTALYPLLCFYRLLQQKRHPALPYSDTRLPPRLVNECLAALLTGEAALLRHVTLPWGLS